MACKRVSCLVSILAISLILSDQRLKISHRNPFDVAGARNAGLQAIWIDRAGMGWVDRASTHKPSTVVHSLSAVADFVKGL